MQAVNVSSPIDSPCPLCLEQTLSAPVGRIYITACCRKMIHDDCWQKWEDQPASGEPVAGFINSRRLAFRKCSLCQQNAAPLIHMSTVAYKNSSFSYLLNGDEKVFLRQLASDASGGVSHEGLRNVLRIPTLSELVEGELGPANSRRRNSSARVPRFRPTPPDKPSAFVEPFLLQACNIGDPELIRAIVNTHPNRINMAIYSISHRRRLPMIFVAADNGHVESVKILASASDGTFSNSLDLAVDDANLSALRTLVSAALAHGGSIARILTSKVYQAAIQCDQTTLTQLFSAGAKADSTVNSAIDNGNLQILSALIRAGISKDEIVYKLASKNAGELLSQLFCSDTGSSDDDCGTAAAMRAARQEDVPALNVLASTGVQLQQVLLNAAQCNAGNAAVKTLLNAGANAHEALSLAAEQGDELVFTTLLSSLGSDPIVFLRSGAERGDQVLVQKLLEANTGAGCEEGDPLSPLFIAAGNNHKEVVQAIFDFYSSTGEYRPTMIYRAALVGDDQTLLCLLKAHSDKEQNIRDVIRVLQMAINDTDNGRYALTRLTAISHPDEVGFVLISLISAGDAHMLAKLLQLGADPNFADSNGWSLLHAATSKGDPELVKLLLDHGAALHQLSNSGASALSLAASLGNKPMVTTLVQASGCNDVHTAISDAIERHDNDTLGHLIGITNASGPDFRQLLMCAARSDNTDAIKTMVQSQRRKISADIAFLHAFNDGNQALTTAFLKAGVGINGPSATSFLLMTAIKGNRPMIAALIRYCTNVINDIYQAAGAQEMDAFAVMVSAYAEINPQEKTEELIKDLVDAGIAYKNQHVFDALVSTEQRTGTIDIGKSLLTALQTRKKMLDNIEMAESHKAGALIDRLNHDAQLAHNFDADDDDAMELTGQAFIIERRIAEYDSAIDECKNNIQNIDYAIKSFIQAGAIRVISAESAHSMFTLAVHSYCPQLVHMILDSWTDQDPGVITAETRCAASNALLQAIEVKDWDMVRLLTRRAPIDCATLNEKRTVLYDVARSQDSELLGSLWRLGVFASASLNCVLSDTNTQYLQYFIDAGITLDDNDTTDRHPLLKAIEICNNRHNFDLVRLVLDMSKNVDTVIYNEALLEHKHMVAIIWHCCGRQHQQILRLIKQAVSKKDKQIIKTLQQIDGIASELGQCLFEAATSGNRDVTRELIASRVDIHESRHNPARFLYLSACADLHIAGTILDSWKNKNNRNAPVIIKQACDVAKRESGEQSQDICDFFNGWLSREIRQTSEQADSYATKLKPSGT